MNILILAAGAPPIDGAPPYPTWLAEVEGELILERQVRTLMALDPMLIVFVFRREDIASYYLVDIVGQLAPNATVVEVGRQTAGAACTALLASGSIDMDDELIIASATDQIDADYGAIVQSFREKRADAGVLTFPSLHPRYSYVRVDGGNVVLESSEKRPISRMASTGLYWFAQASSFFEAAKEMILKDAHVQGQFYICPALNEMILKQKKILAHMLSVDQYHPLKTDKQVGSFEDSLEGRP